MILSVKHSGNAGDIIYSLPVIKKLSELKNQQVDVYLYLNQPAFYYEGAEHTVKNDQQKDVMLNQYMFDMLKPLLECQSYIGKVEKWTGQQIAIDLDRMRKVPSLMPNGHISRWYFYAYPDLTCDLSKPCLEIPEDSKVDCWHDAIIVNRTSRYRNKTITYNFLNKVEEPVYFVGTLSEYDEFKYHVTKAKYFQVHDFLVLAAMIQNCKLFIGNQSMCFAIAEQLKTPRVVELCFYAPNVIPTGENGYDFCLQEAFEQIVRKLTM